MQIVSPVGFIADARETAARYTLRLKSIPRAQRRTMIERSRAELREVWNLCADGLATCPAARELLAMPSGTLARISTEEQLGKGGAR